MLENFIYAKQKSLFETALNNGEVLDEAIVFIEDTKEIWNHGTYFDGSTFDSSNIELSILNIIDTTLTKTEAAATYQPIGDYATKSELPTKVGLLENDSDYITKTEVADSYLVKGDYALKSDVEVEVENGVYIVDLNGALHDPNAFTGTADEVTGIGLVTDNGSWIVALDEWYSSSESTAWNGNIRSAWGGYNKTVTGCWTGTSNYLNDFNGEANTDAIITQLKGTTDDYSQYYTGAPAAEYCRTYSKGYKDVGSWYLPAAGELNEIVLNKDAIDTILTKLGKNNLTKNPYTWSSSQASSNNAWFYFWSLSNWDNRHKSYGLGVRPICKLELKKPLKEKVSELESSVSELESNISNKADKTEIPTKVSLLENDVPYALKSDVEVEVEVEIEAPNGVYAVTADGELIDYNTADSSCIGVAFISDNQKVMIAKEDATDGTNIELYWGKNLHKQDVPNLEYLADVTAAKADYNGKANTAAIIAGYTTLGKDMDNRDMCKVLETYNEGGYTDWYVPAAGQLYEFYSNKDALNEALAAISGTAFASLIYWSSSEKSADRAWSVGFDDYFVNNYSKNDYSSVRFVRDLTIIKKTLKERVTKLESQLGDINAALDYIINGPTFTILKRVSDRHDGSITYYEYTFNFTKGMTWGEWVNSGYNTASDETIGNEINIGGSDIGKVSFGGQTVVYLTQDEEVAVDLNDLIIENHQYYIPISAGGSN